MTGCGRQHSPEWRRSSVGTADTVVAEPGGAEGASTTPRAAWLRPCVPALCAVAQRPLEVFPGVETDEPGRLPPGCFSLFIC